MLLLLIVIIECYQIYEYELYIVYRLHLFQSIYYKTGSFKNYIHFYLLHNFLVLWQQNSVEQSYLFESSTIPL